MDVADYIELNGYMYIIIFLLFLLNIKVYLENRSCFLHTSNLTYLTPAPQVFRVCGGGRTRHISSKHYMGPTTFYGARAEKPPFCQTANEYMSPKTRMVQLPATAAIEYVAACCTTRTRTRTRTKTKIRTRTKIGTITKTVRGPYARSPQVLCLAT